MKGKPKRTFDSDFKREAVRIADAGDVTDRQVEREPGAVPGSDPHVAQGT